MGMLKLHVISLVANGTVIANHFVLLINKFSDKTSRRWGSSEIFYICQD
jgi:hypothetical protein